MPTHTSTSMILRPFGGLLVASALATAPVVAQTLATNAAARPFQSSASTSAGPGTVAATRFDQPPVIDGLDTDAIWQSAPLQTGFREVRPTEDADPKQNTEFRVAYDAHYLYVFVRAYDTAPDSIIKLLSRRDDQTNSDQIGVMIDSYHDKRTGYEFIVNPVGVKSDYSIAGDGNEDGAWNAIWDVATHIDPQGWSAEYRIPFSQLRFAPSENMTFGFLIWRDLARHTAALSWPLFRQSRSGFPSQFGELTGIQNIDRPERMELAPYFLTQNEPDRSTGGLEREQAVQVGGDLKYAIAPNITMNATVNPDFGQVEADPSVLNLGAFETFFSERRPFFVEGSNVFDFRINCFVVVDCSTGEALFYSRRIGRSPQLGQYDDGESPTSTRILGAAKVTGRFQNGTSIGFLDAATQQVENKAHQTMEPFTNYSVARVNRDFDGGNASFGVMGTATNRSLDQWSEDYLHDGAYSGGIDARRRRGRYEVSGSLMGSYVTGSANAIARTQQQPAHYFQRPDDEITFDPARTSLSGSSVELRFGKVGGQNTRFETGYARRSSGFETNDMGFLRRADQQTWTNWWNYRWMKPNRVFQNLRWNVNYWMYWTLQSGLLEERAINTNFHTQLNNRWGVHLGGTQGIGQTYCARGCTRGGPALKLEPSFSPWGGFDSDQRKKLTFGNWFNYNRGDGGRSHYFNMSPYVAMKLSPQFNTQLSLSYSRNDDDSQWWGNFTDAGGTHYTFADLQQRELGLTWRLDYTFTPDMSFQWYASPFISKGTFSRVREVADPRATNYDDRFVAAPDSIFTTSGDTVVTTAPGGFNFMAFNSNAVFRWEYRPGSTLFLVWSQGRGRSRGVEGNRDFQENLGDLFDTRASDRFLVKVSYWFNR